MSQTLLLLVCYFTTFKLVSKDIDKFRQRFCRHCFATETLHTASQ